jgi:hypothetical protein
LCDLIPVAVRGVIAQFAVDAQLYKTNSRRSILRGSSGGELCDLIPVAVRGVIAQFAVDAQLYKTNSRRSILRGSSGGELCDLIPEEFMSACREENLSEVDAFHLLLLLLPDSPGKRSASGGKLAKHVQAELDVTVEGAGGANFSRRTFNGSFATTSRARSSSTTSSYVSARSFQEPEDEIDRAAVSGILHGSTTAPRSIRTEAMGEAVEVQVRPIAVPSMRFTVIEEPQTLDGISAKVKQLTETGLYQFKLDTGEPVFYRVAKFRNRSGVTSIQSKLLTLRNPDTLSEFLRLCKEKSSVAEANVEHYFVYNSARKRTAGNADTASVFSSGTTVRSVVRPVHVAAAAAAPACGVGGNDSHGSRTPPGPTSSDSSGRTPPASVRSIARFSTATTSARGGSNGATESDPLEKFSHHANTKTYKVSTTSGAGIIHATSIAQAIASLANIDTRRVVYEWMATNRAKLCGLRTNETLRDELSAWLKTLLAPVATTELQLRARVSSLDEMAQGSADATDTLVAMLLRDTAEGTYVDKGNSTTYKTLYAALEKEFGTAAAAGTGGSSGSSTSRQQRMLSTRDVEEITF